MVYWLDGLLIAKQVLFMDYGSVLFALPYLRRDGVIRDSERKNELMTIGNIRNVEYWNSTERIIESIWLGINDLTLLLSIRVCGSVFCGSKWDLWQSN